MAKVKMMDSVVPLYGAKGGRPMAVGSALLIQLTDKRLLVSAAHVLDDMEDGLFVPASEPRPLLGEKILSVAPDGNRKKDKIDIGVAILRQELAEQLQAAGRWFLPAELLFCGAPATEQFQYSFYGYPHGATKVNPRAYTIRSLPEMYTGRCKEATVYSKLEASVGSHIAIEFNKKRVLTNSGQLVTPKDRRGMSGGPVFAYVSQAEDLLVPKIRIVGIAIEHHPDESTLLAVRTEALLALLMRSELAPAASRLKLLPASVLPAKNVGKSEGLMSTRKRA